MVSTPTRLHFAYRHVDRPWGGANNFIRALHASLESCGQFEFTGDIGEDCDILFMNELGMGPANGSRQWPLRAIRRLMRHRPRRLVVRAVNLNRHAFRMGIRNRIVGRFKDRKTLALLDMADHVIFQSHYQRDVFRDAGYHGGRNTVIHNGADPFFWNNSPTPPSSPLRIVSTTASARETKRHDLIAQLSLIPGIEVHHAGLWPAGLNSANVTRHGLLTREQIAALFATSHCLFHPAVKDPCPNSIFEALVGGLPVIYNPGPGSSAEIVGECGLPLAEQDLGSTVEMLRERLGALCEKVLETRSAYLASHSADRYRSVFEQVMLQSPKHSLGRGS